MNRQMIITGVAFLVGLAIALGLLQYVIQLHGAVLKLVISIVVGIIVGGIAFAVTRNTATTA